MDGMEGQISFARVAPKFAQYHQSPGNVVAHLATTLVGLVGAGCLVTRVLVALERGCRRLVGSTPKEGTKELPLCSVSRAVTMAAWAAYAVALVSMSDVPSSLGRASACVIFAAAVLSAKIDANWVGSAALLAAGYLLQDAAHWYFGEETYQQHSWGSNTTSSSTGAIAAGSSSSSDTVAALFFEHVVYLVPLTLQCAPSWARAAVFLLPVVVLSWANFALDSDSLWGLPVSPAKRRLLVGKLGEVSDASLAGEGDSKAKLESLQRRQQAESERADLATLRRWTLRQGPSAETTSHWWVSQLDAQSSEAFERLATGATMRSLFKTKFRNGYRVEPVRGMNEIYVSAPTLSRKKTKSSDDVFFTEHVDGPFCFFPFASLYRCIVALDANLPAYETHFPNAFKSIRAQNGDVLAFDFHRESHYITKGTSSTSSSSSSEQDSDDSDSKFRVVLKLHYVAAPNAVFWWAGNGLRWLSVKYNEMFRALFLATIKPQSKLAAFVADKFVNGFTVAYNAVEKYVGYANVTYYVCVAAIAMTVGSYDVFLYSTQYLHYGRYLSTYYDRKNVAFGSFKRDVLVYKTVALMQLLYLYLTRLDRVYTLLMVVAGYGVSVAATAALGVDGTYFGIELGVVDADYKFVTKFPYSIIPHPMILGQCVAILGMHLGALRLEYPALAPVHVALYLTHLIQEAFDIYDGVPWYNQKNNNIKEAAAAHNSKLD